jgi:hypothetical protein
MSEYTDYYAVKRAPLEEIKAKLEQAKLTALIVDGFLCHAEDRWVVVEAVVSSFFRTLILAERQLDRAQAVVLLI